MKVISVANRKGGVGKTSIAANLAYELKRKGHLVVMIDLDSQADLTKIFLPKVENDEKNIYTLLCGKYRKIEDVCIEIEDNLYLVPGSRDIIHFNEKNGETKLRRYLKDKHFGEIVDFVIIDHPPALNEAALAGFTASDEVLVVTDAEAFSISNLDNLLEDLKGIHNDMNPKLHILGILVNKVDMRRNLTKTMLRQLKNVFGSDVLDTFVSNSTAFPIAISQSIPIRKLKWQGQAVKQIRTVAEEIVERMGIGNGDRTPESQQA